MLVTRGLGRGRGAGLLATSGLGRASVWEAWAHDGSTYRPVKQRFVKHQGQWQQPREVWRRTPTGWRRVL